MRKIFLAFVFALLISAAPMTVFASEKESNQEDYGYLGNADISYFADSGFVIITMEADEDGNPIGTMPELEKIQQNGDAEICGEVAKTITKQFSSNVYYSGGEYAGKVVTTITASYSQVENWAQVEGVRAEAESASSLLLLTPECSMSGDTATVYIKANGITIGSLKYRVYTNGTIAPI